LQSLEYAQPGASELLYRGPVEEQMEQALANPGDRVTSVTRLVAQTHSDLRVSAISIVRKLERKGGTAMKPILHMRQPSILRVLALVISSMVAAAGMWAGTSIVDRQHQAVMQFTGIVTDSECGSTHGTKFHGDANCTRMCVSLGADYALAAGERIYVLRGHPAELNAFAGDMVVVRGKMVSRSIVAVESVAPYILRASLVNDSD